MNEGPVVTDCVMPCDIRRNLATSLLSSHARGINLPVMYVDG